MAVLSRNGPNPKLTPKTPRIPRTTNQVNELIVALNKEFPSLKLRPRSPFESPSSRARNNAELCYDRIAQYFYIAPEELGSCLSSFRALAKQEAEPSLTTLLDCLPVPQPSVRRQGPSTPISSTGRIRDVQTRARTPNHGDADTILQSPGSPSPGASRLMRSTLGSARGKRPSTDKDERISPKVSKVLSTSQSNIYNTSPHSPIQQPVNTSFDSTRQSVMVSFASTVPASGGAAGNNPNISFETNITSDDQDPFYDSRPHKSKEMCFPSNMPNLPSSSQRQSDGTGEVNDKPSKSQLKPTFIATSSNLSARLQRVNDWRQSVQTAAGIQETSDASDSDSISSNSSETQEAFIRMADKALPLCHNATPTHAFRQLNIKDHTRKPAMHATASPMPFAPVESHQIRYLANHDLFVPDYEGPLVDFKVLWECQRFSLASGLAIEHFLSQRATTDDYDTFIASLAQALPELVEVPKLSSRRCWKPTARGCVQYSASAVFSKSCKAKYLFELLPSPLGYEESSRIQEKYGAERVLKVYFPDLNKMPRNLDGFRGMESIQERFVEFLCTSKRFLGREWRAIRLEQTKVKATDTERFGGYRVDFVALAGPGIPNTTVSDVVGWHIDLKSEKNLSESFRKIHTRMDLAFSKTTPTFIFRPGQVIFKKDVLADGTPEPTKFNDTTFDWTTHFKARDNSSIVMTDGAGLISVGAAKAIWKQYGGTGPPPAAFQGRINGSKGMWVRSGPADSTDDRDLDIWIEINESQVKLECHASDTDDDYDPHRWTFEVLRVTESKSQDALKGSLHMDMIPLLCDRGVKIADIQTLINEVLIKEGKNLLEVFHDPEEARYWVLSHSNGADGRKRTDTDLNSFSGLPLDYGIKAVYFLESGFVPIECVYLGEQLIRVAERYFSQALQKLSIPLEQSVNLKGIPDPLGVLEPGTVHVAFSKSFYDPVSGEYTNHLHGHEAVITRHPMKMPSDMQRIRIVYNPKLAYLKDHIVFPVKGQVFLCSLLQGGDLDGDVYILIWDKRIVAGFRNAPLPQAVTPYQEFGIHKDVRTLRDVLVGEDPVTNFLREGFKARLQPVPLGRVSNLIKREAYRKGDGAYRSPAVLKLLELYNFLIDADKNGYSLDDNTLKRYLAELANNGHVDDPDPPKAEYEKAMNEGVKIYDIDRTIYSNHPNDVIFFEHVRPQAIQILKQLSNFVEGSKSFSDQTLQKIYKDYHANPDARIQAEVKRLESEFKGIRCRWQGAFTKGNRIESTINDFKAEYSKIWPMDADFARSWTESRFPQQPSEWALLKASALYTLFHQSKRTSIIWHLAAPELAYIKAHNSKHRIVVEPQYALLKTRKRKIKLIFEPDGVDGMSEDGLDEPGDIDAGFNSTFEDMDVDA